jgi:hypothetical protein
MKDNGDSKDEMRVLRLRLGVTTHSEEDEDEAVVM